MRACAQTLIGALVMLEEVNFQKDPRRSTAVRVTISLFVAL
jgi:hypothetical protein